MLLTIFQNIPDIAGADAQAFRRHHGVLGGDDGIGHSQQQVPRPRGAGSAAGVLVGVVPLLAVGTEDQHQGGLGNKGLVIAGDSQGLLQRLAGDIKDGVKLLVPRGGGLAGGLQNQAFFLRGDGILPVGTDRFAPKQLLQYLVHTLCNLL